MRRYCYIAHPMKGRVRFDLFPFQVDTLMAFGRHRFNIILKSRQLGISTLAAAYSLWRMCFRDDYTVLIIATKQDVAKNLVSKVRVMYDNMPSWLRPKEVENNKLGLKLENGSGIKATGSRPDAGRSEALSLLIMDEAAFIQAATEIWTSVQSTLSTGGDAILLSTPNGVGNFFHQKWVDAETNNTMNTIRLPWTVHPERDQSWREDQTKLLGERAAAQECDCLGGNSTIRIQSKLGRRAVYDATLKQLYDKLPFAPTLPYKPSWIYNVKTPNGFRDFSGIRELEHDEYFRITLETGKTLECSITHPFVFQGEELRASEMEVGSHIDSPDGIVEVIGKEHIKESILLYDLIQVDGGNVFLVDGIVSHNCSFVSSGHSVVDGETMEWYEQNMVQDPVEKRGASGDYWIWEYPKPGVDYAITADVARGDGEDYSTFHIFDVENLVQVAEFKSKVGTTEFGSILVTVATEYNDALLCIENSNVGWAVIQVVMDRKYKNLYYSMKADQYIDESMHLAKNYDAEDKSKLVAGFTTNTKTRPLMIAKFETYMRERTPIIRSSRTMNEMKVFIWENGKAMARRGYNDDLIMALCIAFWVRDTALRLRQMGIELMRKTLENFDQPLYLNNERSNAPGWSMDINGRKEKLNWLL